MKILVSGGAGFIGTNFIKFINKKYDNYKIVCVDNLSVKESALNLEYLNKLNNFKFIKGDITDKSFIDKLFEKEKFNLVVNFAAEVAVDYSIKNPNVFIKTNILGTSILMNACLKYNVTRYHQISTDEVYGDLPLKSRKSFDEKSHLSPSNPYSASKASADMLVLSYYRTYGLKVTISRCTNNYGPHQSYRALIPLTIKNAINNKKIPVFGKGDNIRDWIYVNDHVMALDLIIHKGTPGQIYNISGNSKKNNLYVIKTILKELNKNENLISFVLDRPGHDRMYSINSKKIEKDLKWKRTYSFNKGIKKTINWYKKTLT